MNIFTLIKSRVSIVDVIGNYTTLRKAGHYLKSQCPFHQEKTASFTVSPGKEIFYCFGCHVNGDAITFVSKIEQCSLMEAAKLLAERYSIELPSSLSHDESSHNEKKRYFEICHQVAQWCHERLKKNTTALEYLLQRGITPKSIDLFNLGYFPGGLQATKQLIQDMNKQSILVNDLISVNVLVQGKNILYSPFEERIMFPIKDYMGRFCGFGGRIFKAGDTRPKYYNSRENEFFQKGSLLFGLDQAKKAIQQQEQVFLVEGYTDCIAMVQHGYPATVATLGTACTAEHLKILSRYARTMYVVYDGDSAGQQAMLRLAQLCWQATLDLKVIRLPEQHDPASYLTTHKSLESLVSTAEDIFLFFVQSTGSNFSQKTLGEKLQLTRKIIETINTVDDELKQDFLLQQASLVLEMPFESLKHALVKLAKPEPKHAGPDPKEQVLEETFAPAPVHTLGKLEKQIFFAIMSNTQLLKTENAWYLITFLPEPLRTIIASLQEKKSVNPAIDFIQLYDSLEPDNQQLVSRIMVEEAPVSGEKDFDALLSQLQKNHWKVIVNNIKLRIEQAKKDGDEQRVADLVQEFVNLRQKLIGKEMTQPKDR